MAGSRERGRCFRLYNGGGLLNYSDFISALPNEKKNSDPLWARYFLRRVSLPVAWFLMRSGLSGNAVSLIGVILSMVAAVMLAGSTLGIAIIGAFLFLLVSLGDCVDGNIARAKGETGPMGDFMDALGGYTVYALLPLALGFRAESIQGIDELPGLLMLLGAAVAVSNLYMRLVHQKYLNMMIDSQVGTLSASGTAKEPVAKRISSELGLIGWMMPLLLLAVTFGLEWLYLVAYALFYGLASVAMTAKTALLAYRSV